MSGWSDCDGVFHGFIDESDSGPTASLPDSQEFSNDRQKTTYSNKNVFIIIDDVPWT